MAATGGVGRDDDALGAAGAQLWAAVRGFSDAELQRVRRRIRRYHSCFEASSVGPATTEDTGDDASDTTTIQVQLGAAEPQRVRVDSFVHVFTDYLHRQVQLHADSGVATGVASSAATSAPPTTTTSETATFGTDAAFELHQDEFPQLAPRAETAGKSGCASSRRAAKPAKRRITTTLLTRSESTAVTRPVPTAVAFPPLGSNNSSYDSAESAAWDKRSLLEKRMGSASSGPARAPAWGATPVKKSPAWPLVQRKAAAAPSAAARSSPGPTTRQIPPNETQSKPETPSSSQLQVKKASGSNRTPVVQPKDENPAAPEHEEARTATSKDGHDSPAVQELPDAPAAASAGDLRPNKQAAKLYGFLIRERFVSSTCAELQVLLSLLFRADCRHCSSVHATSAEESNNAAESAEASACEAPSEFCWRTHCLAFAELAFNEVETVLAHLDSDLLRLVKQSLRGAGPGGRGLCAAMLERLEHVAQQREELRVRESARIGCPLPIELKAHAVRDFALPFCEETDSRLHYRTPAEAFLYSNREKVRDGFLGLLRQFQQQQHSLEGMEDAGVAAAAMTAARKLLRDVLPENRWWFARFFVLELVQVGANPFGESDEDLVLQIMEDKLVEKNPDRLRKLHRRFSSQKPSTKAQSPSPSPSRGRGNASSSATTSSSSSSSKGGKASGGAGRRERPEASADDGAKSLAATLARMRGYFAENQLFFFHFLHSCDSFELSQLVKQQLERQFQAIHEAARPAADPRQGFTEVVLQLKVVAKFLGYLRFSPQWPVTTAIRRLSGQNAAFRALERDGTHTLEAGAGASGLDVKLLLERSVLSHSLAKCVPWLCDYLSMLARDRLSSGTTYFRQLLLLLQLVYRSPRLETLRDTGLYLALQLERVFHVLGPDVAAQCRDDLRTRHLLPPPAVRLALALDDEASARATAHHPAGEDELPFLYSQVFVQSCVAELDDLRSFLQTRAQPSHRVGRGGGATGATGAAAPRPAAGRRKLRPLQLARDDAHGSDDRHEARTRAAASPAARALAPRTHESGQRPGTRSPERQAAHQLAEAVFKVHPKLKTAVDFVVGAVTTDVCAHVIARAVTRRADALVDVCAAESGLPSARPGVEQHDDVAGAARAAFHVRLAAQTRAEVQAASACALEDALRLAHARVRTAVPALVPPTTHPTLAQAAGHVAQQRTRELLQTLVPKSAQTEFVKRVGLRSKALLKDAGSSAAAATATATATATEPRGTSSAARDGRERGQTRQRRLARCSAEISRAAARGASAASRAEPWETQVAILSRLVSEFTAELGATRSETSARRPRGGRATSLRLWDAVWRAVRSCLRFLSRSLAPGAPWRLQGDAVPSSVERRLDDLTQQFVALLATLARVCGPLGGDADEDATAGGRVRAVLTLVLDCVLTLPPGVVCGPSHDDLVPPLAVRCGARVVRGLRDEAALGDVGWRLWTPEDGTGDARADPRQTQFRRQVWTAVDTTSDAA